VEAVHDRRLPVVTCRRLVTLAGVFDGELHSLGKLLRCIQGWPPICRVGTAVRRWWPRANAAIGCGGPPAILTVPVLVFPSRAVWVFPVECGEKKARSLVTTNI